MACYPLILYLSTKARSIVADPSPVPVQVESLVKREKMLCAS